MKKKLVITGSILAFWAVYYVQNHTGEPQVQEEVLAEKVQDSKAPEQTTKKPTDVNEKKSNFFTMLKPGIAEENQRILKERAMLDGLKASLPTIDETQLTQAKKLAEEYNLSLENDVVTSEWLDEMYHRVNVLPQALVLTQAANESAWGTSRFAKQGNNYFGQWCYTKGCGLVPLQRNEGATHEVAKFDSYKESIHAYFMNVNRNRAYNDLRNIRAELSEKGMDLESTEVATQLTNGLLSYSERGQDYVNDLQAMMRHNAEYFDK